MKIKYLAPLKEEVEKVFGRRVLTYSDCINLSEDIFSKTSSRLNVNTLRRCFNLVKITYPPSVNTLDILSRFCGFNSYDHFIKFKEREPIKESNEVSILLDYLISLFRHTIIADTNNIAYKSIVHHTIKFLSKHQELIDPFQRAIAKTRMGQEFYFEQFVNIDKLNAYYGDGLRYYLLEKKTKEAQLFAHSVLCFRYWLIKDAENLEIHYNQLLQYDIDNEIAPFICGRYFAAQLFYAERGMLAKDEITERAIRFYSGHPQGKGKYQHFPHFEFIMAEALLLTGHFKESVFYVNEAIKKENVIKQTHIDKHLLTTLYLYKSILYALQGELEKAEELYIVLKNNEFHFLSRQYCTILYLLLGVYLKKVKINKSQVDYLVAETGFKNLMSIFSHTSINNKKV